jgi:hypothetical membrane protein
VTTLTRRLAAIAPLAGPAIYIAAEAISSIARKNPTYRYADNWISELGSTTQGVFQGRPINSPLHNVMNAGFILQGVLFAAGTVFLSRSMTGKIATRDLNSPLTWLLRIRGLPRQLISYGPHGAQLKRRRPSLLAPCCSSG